MSLAVAAAVVVFVAELEVLSARNLNTYCIPMITNHKINRWS